MLFSQALSTPNIDAKFPSQSSIPLTLAAFSFGFRRINFLFS